MDKPTKKLTIAGVTALLLFAGLQIIPRIGPETADRQQQKAANLMAKMMKVTSAMRYGGGQYENAADPNRTGIIGREESGMTTTLGHLEAKRTAAQPAMAAAVVQMLTEAGVSAGDTVAVGASGSFPGLVLAVFAAVQTVKAHPVSIISLGASAWGANETDNCLLDICTGLHRAGLVENLPSAVSLGGGRDVGEGFGPGVKAKLSEKIRKSGLPFIQVDSLAENVSRRMRIYPPSAKVFINTGGAWANLGISANVLKLKPGLNKTGEIPVIEEQGTIFRMLAEGVPVIHLLYMKGLALKYGLAWDPPELTLNHLPGTEKRGGRRTMAAGLLYFIFLGFLFLPGYIRELRSR